MKKREEKWRSPSLGKQMNITIYGDSGTPIIGLPTRGMDAHQWEKEGMTNAISYQIENGFNQLFCLDSVDEESFLNEKVHPQKRLLRHEQYESYIIDEVVPFITDQNSVPYVMIAGVDMGGYHAITLALKHPTEFNKAIGISGVYDIKTFFGDFYCDRLYFNNPVDFVPNINKQSLLNAIRNVDFRLVSYANDPRLGHAHHMGQAFRKKFIEHQLDIWDLAADDAWDLWQDMLCTHII